MQFLLSFITILSVVLFTQGRSYGYSKKKIVKKPVVILDTKIQLCRPGCTRQWISPECREETYGFENGVKCKGCDRDICRGGPIGGDNIGIDNWQNGQDWQLGGNWRDDRFHNQGQSEFGNDGFLNQGQDGFGNDGFLNQGQGEFLNQGRNRGFLDSFSSKDVFNQGQGRFVNKSNNFDSLQNGQFGNRW